MNLPPGVFERFRQPHLIRINEWAVIRIETDKDRYPHNIRYKIKNLTFQEAIAPYLLSDWGDFDKFFYIKDRTEKDRDAADDQAVSVVYSKAEHYGEPRLPNIIVVPNLLTGELRGISSPLTVLGSTMGHYNPASRNGYSIQEVYEFQSYGLLVLDHENGQVEMWVAKDGDKVSIPTESHVTLYNLGNKDHPLICLNLSDVERTASNKDMIRQWGPILLIYYDDSEVTFVLNQFYINNDQHSAGVRIKGELRNISDRQVKLSLGARLDLGRLLYEQLTQNSDLIGQFARLGIRIKQASSEAFLEPFSPGKALRLYFSLPLVEISKKGTDVYRYFSHSTEPARPDPSNRLLTGAEPEAQREKEAAESHARSVELNRPLVVLVEGVGDWIEQTYRPLFYRKVNEDNQRLSVFYTDDTRWKSRPKWASSEGMDLQAWEVYLDKADPNDFASYRKLRPDVVFVVTPDFTHSLIAQAWLNKVPTIFVEKPFDSQVKNIEDLRRNTVQPSKTEVLGLDHYQFYALPVESMKAEINAHLGVALAEVTFYLTEDRPIEVDRLMSLQYGLTLDLLPHLFALLTYFGKISTIDQIKVIEAGRYTPMQAWPRDTPEKKIEIEEQYRNETYSRVEFTFQDDSGNGYNVPCTAVVGKGFSQEVKYLEIIGLSGNAIRIDLKQRPNNTIFPDYPWDCLFFIQRQPLSVFTGVSFKEVRDPYNPSRILRILDDGTERFRPQLFRRRYEELIDDLLNGTTGAVRSTLTVSQGQSIVRALDRIWWAIQLMQDSWKDYPLLQQSPFALVPDKIARASGTRDLQDRIQTAALEKNILPTALPQTTTAYERDMDESRDSRPVQTRGPLFSTAPTKSRTLKNLIADVRKYANGMPLTVIIHKWQMQEALSFLAVLSNVLQKWDAIWLVSSSQTQDSPGSDEVVNLPTNLVDKVITLDLTGDMERRLFNNLIGDIVFMADARQEDLELIKGFQQRCRFLIFDIPINENEWLLKALEDINTNVGRWLGRDKDAVQINPQITTVQEVSGSLEISNKPILDEIGLALKALATQIEKDPEKVPTRRGEFRSQITKIIDSYPSHSTWNEDLARQACKHEWPSWAVESLPSLYIPLAQSDGERSMALVWEYIVACIPKKREYSIKDERCGKQLLEISMPAATNKIVEDVAGIFNKYLRYNPHSSEGSFLAGINRALLEIKIWLQGQNLETSEEYDLKLNDVRGRMSLRE